MNYRHINESSHWSRNQMAVMQRDYAIITLYFCTNGTRHYKTHYRPIDGTMYALCKRYESRCIADAFVGEDSYKNTLCNECYNAHIALLYRHGNYMIDDKHTTRYQREEEVKDMK